MALAVVLVSQTVLLSYVFTGHPWQVETHFYFFVVLAMLSGFCDTTILLTAAGLVAFFHVVLNVCMPDVLYPGGGNLLRAFVHSGLVLLETTMLIAIGGAIKSGFARRAGRPRLPHRRALLLSPWAARAARRL